VTELTRTSPPRIGDELATSNGFLDYLREAIVLKASGLDDEAVRRSMTPSGVSLLGIVKHLTAVERWWFAHNYAGLDVDFPWTSEDPDADWRIEPHESTQDVIDAYLAECARSRELIDGRAADSLSARESKHEPTRFTLRWIVTHMVEETGRHAGHADILRELIDGSTGE
jgi:uncharacterized damage-inducible protein DinB